MNRYFNYKDELYHHGVLGMKWGVRRYQPYGSGGYSSKNKQVRNKNYSDTQRKQDRRIYGKRSEKRINKRMNEGENILSARHAEVVRRERIKLGKKIGSYALAGAATIGLGVILKKNPELVKKGKQVTNDYFGNMPLNFGYRQADGMFNPIGLARRIDHLANLKF